MLEAPTLWGLIEARAAATPDALMAVDEHRPRDDVRRLPGPGGGGGRRSGRRLRHRARGRGDLAAADLARVDGAGRRHLPPGGHPEPGAAHLPRARGRLLRAPGRLEAAHRPVGLRRLRLRGHGRGHRHRGGRGRRGGVLTSDRSLPEGDPVDAAGEPPASGDDVRWLFYTSGTTADPKGAQHTDRTIGAVARGMAAQAGLPRPATATPWPSRSPTSAASPGCSPACRRA